MDTITFERKEKVLLEQRAESFWEREIEVPAKCGTVRILLFVRRDEQNEETVGVRIPYENIAFYQIEALFPLPAWMNGPVRLYGVFRENEGYAVKMFEIRKEGTGA
ncbi:MAG TPA: hypothetical protein VHF05_01290 [Candidatus Paceibacterota bacterium]|jgi:hypothetical protein|nr:hypothetical protein [Candidatus Paceibacterota bacterium]